MKSINPKLLIALAAVIALALGLKVINPNKKYSTRQFWEAATVSTVATVPEKALQPGNKNGSVLMWAAMGAKDPAILQALVEWGANVNESDEILGGTPLSAAASESERPEMIAALVSLGADVNKRVNNGETVAMLAAQHNTAPGIVEALRDAGADLGAENHQGKTALGSRQRAQERNSRESAARTVTSAGRFPVDTPTGNPRQIAAETRRSRLQTGKQCRAVAFLIRRQTRGIRIGHLDRQTYKRTARHRIQVDCL